MYSGCVRDSKQVGEGLVPSRSKRQEAICVRKNVIPTEVGIQTHDIALDSRFHGNDGLLTLTTVTGHEFLREEK